jgi:hypothetical protein
LKAGLGHLEVKPQDQRQSERDQASQERHPADQPCFRFRQQRDHYRYQDRGKQDEGEQISADEIHALLLSSIQAYFQKCSNVIVVAAVFFGIQNSGQALWLRQDE